MRWSAGSDGAPRIRRIEYSNGETGGVSAVEFDYGPHNEITEERRFNYDGSLRTRIITEYLNDPRYEAHHVFGLPTRIRVFEGRSAVAISRTDYYYDQFPLVPRAGAAQNHTLVDTVRGNVTTIVRYANAASGTGAMEERRTYDIFGNVATISPWLGAQSVLTYSNRTEYAYPDSIASGGATPDQVQLIERFEYDRSLGSLTRHYDVSGVRTDLDYDAVSGELSTVKLGQGGVIRQSRFNGRLMTVETKEDDSGNVIAREAVSFDGRGHAVKISTLAEDVATDVHEIQFDVVGRVVARSLPYRNPANIVWRRYERDLLGRVTAMTLPDGSRIRMFFNEPRRPAEASRTVGPTERVVDPWGRERWYRYDIDGRLVEVAEPNPKGDGRVFGRNALITRYSYGPLGRLTRVEQGPQVRLYEYDSLGRLLRQRVPEKTDSLSAAGNCDPVRGAWSDVYAYDSRTGQIARVTDARGVRTSFDYGTDALGRLQRVSFDSTQLCNTSRSIVAVAATTVEYWPKGDVRQPRSVRTNGAGVVEYGYDSKGRLAFESTTLDRFPSNELRTDYAYDALGRLSGFQYPAQWI
jgi:YD repeat-containing protein